MKRTVKTMHEKHLDNILTRTHYITCLIALIIAFALAGCGKKIPKAPPKQMVEDTLRAGLPPFLSLDSIELEPIPIGPESVKVKFKAVVAPKEDLYQVDREVEGTPKVTLLKVSQTAGAKASLYGSVDANRIMDLWTLGSLQIEIGLQQFGSPRGTFDAQSYITGSSEASAALKEQAANAQLQEQARKAAMEQRELEQKALLEQQAREEKARLEREEQARIAFEEQQKKEEEQRKKDEEQQQKEEEADRQKLILATAFGTRYIGTIKPSEDTIERLRLIFTEQNLKDFLISAEVSNPTNPKWKRTFSGELRFNPKLGGDDSVAYHIVMTGLGKADYYSRNNIYNSSSPILKLRLTDIGLEGECGGQTIRLQRQGEKRPTTSSTPRPPVKEPNTPVKDPNTSAPGPKVESPNQS